MQENTDHREQPLDNTSAPVPEQPASWNTQPAAGIEPLTGQPNMPRPITLEDLLEVPRQILPEQTYTHLVNAGREARLAFVSLFNGLSDNFNSMKGGSSGSKVRKHIDVE